MPLHKLLETADENARRNILELRTNQRREYLLSVSNLVGLRFWSESDDLALDAIDNRLAEVLIRANAAPSINGVAAALSESIPSFLTKEA